MKNLRQIVLTFALLAVTTASAEGQQKLTREAYILKYKPLAVEQMDIYGIPASIKLAQALFESDNGNSRLAREANNHFGIKCKSNWTGQTISHTDDAPDECFRKYPSVEESYRADVRTVASDYQANGAAALSILTDTPYFGGSAEDLIAARPQIDIPILRKDFTIDEFQLYESRAIGADAVLLIAAALPLARCRELAATAHRLGLEVLLEIHSEKELDYISDEVDMIGVNNRNLGTFDTRVGNSFRLAGQLPQDRLLVSESGISDPETVKKLREAGFRGFLIGENFMKTADPGYGLDTFIKTLNL